MNSKLYELIKECRNEIMLAENAPNNQHRPICNNYSPGYDEYCEHCNRGELLHFMKRLILACE